MNRNASNPTSRKAVNSMSPACRRPRSPRPVMPGSCAAPGRRVKAARCPTTLLGVLDGPRLADDRDLDLARVRELLLDLADDVACQSRSGEVVDLLGPD